MYLVLYDVVWLDMIVIADGSYAALIVPNVPF